MKKEQEMEHLGLLRLDAVRSGEGTAAERRHVDSCGACRSEVERMERYVAGTGAAMPGALKLSGRDRRTILEDLRRETSTRPFPLPRPRHALPLAAAAAALAAFIVLLPGRQGEMEDPGGEPAVSREPSKRPVLDVNGDGFLDSGDVDELARIIGGEMDSSDRWDFNGDGKADGADIDYLSREIEGDWDESAAGC